MWFGEGIFWVSVVGWTFFIGGRGWLEVYFGWVGLAGHFYCWAGMGEGGWRYILIGWG